MHIRNQDGKGEVRKLKLSGAGFYESLLWSPDSRKLSFADNSWSLYWLDLDKGTIRKIASEYLYGPGRARNVYSAWSPDSNWIAYTLGGKSYIESVYVYSVIRTSRSRSRTA